MIIEKWFKKIVSLMLTSILMLSGTTVFAAGDWTTERNGHKNLGIQTMSGNTTNPSESYNNYITGSITSSVNECDVNGDGYNDIILVEGGCVTALDRNFNQLWKTSVINASDVWGVYDLDNNGTKELIVPCYKSLKIISVSNGNVIWSQSVANALTYPRFKVVDVDSDNKLEIIFHVVQNPYIYCYSFANGVSNGSLKWCYTDTRTYEQYNIGAAPPEIAVDDIDGDGIKEVAVMSYGCRLDFLDARTGILEESHSYTNWATSPNGATAVADSEYQPWPYYPASNMIDGNVSSYWINNRIVPGWVQVNLNGTKNIKYVNLFGLSGTTGFNVQVWDGSQWITEYSTTSNNRAQVLITLNNKMLISKVKVNITNTTNNDGIGNGNQCQLSEIQVYEDLPAINWAGSVNGASAAADSEYQPWPHYPASNAIDGNESTYWINNQTVPGWVQVNLYDSQNIQFVMLTCISGIRVSMSRHGMEVNG